METQTALFESPAIKQPQAPDHLKCKACGARAERGIANVSAHWVECEGKDFTDKLMELAKTSKLTIDSIERIK